MSSQQYARISEGPSAFNKFSSNKYISGTKDFLESNTIVAKFAFLLLVLLVFVVLLRIGTSIMDWMFSPSTDPILINGMIDAKQMMKIPQDPSVSGSMPILRSNNQQDGLVFTWSVWIYIEDLQYNQDQFKHIFHKGNDNINVSTKPYGINQPNNAPGLYITPYKNDLVLIMNTFNNINEEILIPDVPLNKWLNIIIRVDEQHKLDVYVNGKLTRRHILSGIPKQNYGDVYVSMNGGFSGYTSSLRYFSEAIGTNKIQSIVNAGPNMKIIGNSSMSNSIPNPNFLSTRWYFTGTNDMYNP